MIRESKKREDIMCVIRYNPGIRFREIMRRTGMKNGALSNHLRTIERSGTVRVERHPRRIHYCPLEISGMESSVCRHLRRDTPRRIILALMHEAGVLAFDEVVDRAGRSVSTVSVFLSQLVNDGIVEKSLRERKGVCRIRDRGMVDGLIERYHPGMLDGPASAMGDIINVL